MKEIVSYGKKKVKKDSWRTISTQDRGGYSREINVKRSIEGTNNLNLLVDLENNYPVFYAPLQPIYIHNHSRNFLIAGQKVQSELNKLHEQIIDKWKKDINSLHHFMEMRQAKFFQILQSLTGESYDIKNFAYKFNNFTNEYIAKLDINLGTIKNIINDKSKIPRGKKTLDQLRILAEQYNNLFKYVKLIKQKGTIDESTLIYLQKHLEGINKFIKDNKRSGGDKIKFNKVTQNTVLKDLSVTKLNANTIPRILESQVGVIFEEWIKSLTDKQIPDLFKIGYNKDGTQYTTSSDIYLTDGKLLNFGFSIKSKQEQQIKARLLKNFFIFDERLKNNDIISVDNIFNLLTSKNIIGALNYIIMNYAYLNIQDPTILKEVSSVVLLSNLNEKLFGYNKKEQKNRNLMELINEMPIAIITGAKKDNSGLHIMFMTEVLDSILKQISDSFVNVDTLGKVTIKYRSKSKPTSKNNDLMIAKQAFMTKNPNDINYEAIKKGILGKLEVINHKLSNDIQLSVQYKLKLKGNNWTDFKE